MKLILTENHKAERWLWNKLLSFILEVDCATSLYKSYSLSAKLLGVYLSTASFTTSAARK